MPVDENDDQLYVISRTKSDIGILTSWCSQRIRWDCTSTLLWSNGQNGIRLLSPAREGSFFRVCAIHTTARPRERGPGSDNEIEKCSLGRGESSSMLFSSLVLLTRTWCIREISVPLNVVCRSSRRRKSSRRSSRSLNIRWFCQCEGMWLLDFSPSLH